jgi:hypothetical protein
MIATNNTMNSPARFMLFVVGEERPRLEYGP